MLAVRRLMPDARCELFGPRRLLWPFSLIAIALAVFMVAKPTAGQNDTVPAFYNGKKLLAQCNSYDMTERGLCAGFIAGVADTFSAVMKNGGTLWGLRVCAPDGADLKEAQDIVVQHLRAHTEDREVTAAALAAEALAAAWPCP
jgi:Rap1a immunity proteins